MTYKIIDKTYLEGRYPKLRSQLPNPKLSLYKNDSVLMDRSLCFMLQMDDETPVTGLFGGLDKNGNLLLINAEKVPYDKHQPIPVKKNQKNSGQQFKVSSTQFFHFLVEHFKLNKEKMPIYFALKEKKETGILIMDAPIPKKEAEKGLYKPRRKINAED